jgi:hypothetical protein
MGAGGRAGKQASRPSIGRRLARVSLSGSTLATIVSRRGLYAKAPPEAIPRVPERPIAGADAKFLPATDWDRTCHRFQSRGAVHPAVQMRWFVEPAQVVLQKKSGIETRARSGTTDGLKEGLQTLVVAFV